MRNKKLLSALLAFVLVCTCAVGMLIFNASAEREAVTYTVGGEEGETNFASIEDALTAAAEREGGWSTNEYLKIEVTGEYTATVENGILFGQATIFDNGGERLPITITGGTLTLSAEGWGQTPAFDIITYQNSSGAAYGLNYETGYFDNTQTGYKQNAAETHAATDYVACANSYTFQNMNFYIADTSVHFYAGSGEVVLDTVDLSVEDTCPATAAFHADSPTADVWAGWSDPGTDKIHTSLEFKNTDFDYTADTAKLIKSQVVAMGPTEGYTGAAVEPADVEVELIVTDSKVTRIYGRDRFAHSPVSKVKMTVNGDTTLAGIYGVGSFGAAESPTLGAVDLSVGFGKFDFEVEFNDGTVTGTGTADAASAYFQCGALFAGDMTITINDGTFNGTMRIAYASDSAKFGGNCTVNINGGSFKIFEGANAMAGEGNIGALNVTAGTFNSTFTAVRVGNSVPVYINMEEAEGKSIVIKGTYYGTLNTTSGGGTYQSISQIFKGVTFESYFYGSGGITANDPTGYSLTTVYTEMEDCSVGNSFWGVALNKNVDSVTTKLTRTQIAGNFWGTRENNESKTDGNAVGEVTNILTGCNITHDFNAIGGNRTNTGVTSTLIGATVKGNYYGANGKRVGTAVNTIGEGTVIEGDYYGTVNSTTAQCTISSLTAALLDRTVWQTEKVQNYFNGGEIQGDTYGTGTFKFVKGDMDGTLWHSVGVVENYLNGTTMKGDFVGSYTEVGIYRDFTGTALHNSSNKAYGSAIEDPVYKDEAGNAITYRLKNVMTGGVVEGTFYATYKIPHEVTTTTEEVTTDTGETDPETGEPITETTTVTTNTIDRSNTDTGALLYAIHGNVLNVMQGGTILGSDLAYTVVDNEILSERVAFIGLGSVARGSNVYNFFGKPGETGNGTKFVGLVKGEDGLNGGLLGSNVSDWGVDTMGVTATTASGQRQAFNSPVDDGYRYHYQVKNWFYDLAVYNGTIHTAGDGRPANGDPAGTKLESGVYSHIYVDFAAGKDAYTAPIADATFNLDFNGPFGGTAGSSTEYLKVFVYPGANVGTLNVHDGGVRYDGSICRAYSQYRVLESYIYGGTITTFNAGSTNNQPGSITTTITGAPTITNFYGAGNPHEGLKKPGANSKAPVITTNVGTEEVPFTGTISYFYGGHGPNATVAPSSATNYGPIVMDITNNIYGDYDFGEGKGGEITRFYGGNYYTTVEAGDNAADKTATLAAIPKATASVINNNIDNILIRSNYNGAGSSRNCDVNNTLSDVEFKCSPEMVKSIDALKTITNRLTNCRTTGNSTQYKGAEGAASYSGYTVDHVYNYLTNCDFQVANTWGSHVVVHGDSEKDGIVYTQIDGCEIAGFIAIHGDAACPDTSAVAIVRDSDPQKPSIITGMFNPYYNATEYKSSTVYLESGIYASTLPDGETYRDVTRDRNNSTAQREDAFVYLGGDIQISSVSQVNFDGLKKYDNETGEAVDVESVTISFIKDEENADHGASWVEGQTYVTVPEADMAKISTKHVGVMPTYLKKVNNTLVGAAGITPATVSLEILDRIKLKVQFSADELKDFFASDVLNAKGEQVFDFNGVLDLDNAGTIIELGGGTILPADVASLEAGATLNLYIGAVAADNFDKPITITTTCGSLDAIGEEELTILSIATTGAAQQSEQKYVDLFNAIYNYGASVCGKTMVEFEEDFIQNVADDPAYEIGATDKIQFTGMSLLMGDAMGIRFHGTLKDSTSVSMTFNERETGNFRFTDKGDGTCTLDIFIDAANTTDVFTVVVSTDGDPALAMQTSIKGYTEYVVGSSDGATAFAQLVQAIANCTAVSEN